MLGIFKAKLDDSGEVLFRVKVQPSSGRSEIVGVADDETLKVALKAAPERGKANDELVRLLSREFAVGGGEVKIISGSLSRLKLVRITG